jgi:hypothetical protein
MQAAGDGPTYSSEADAPTYSDEEVAAAPTYFEMVATVPTYPAEAGVVPTYSEEEAAATPTCISFCRPEANTTNLATNIRNATALGIGTEATTISGSLAARKVDTSEC